MAIIGIDLGTSNSAAAVLRGGRPVIIPSAEGISLGGKAFPSYVAVTADGQILVGEPARRQAAANPEGTATAFKRRMGRREKIRLRDREFSPEQLSAFLLQKIVRDATAFLGEPVKQAVVTVPAYFDDNQRSATKDACAIAALDVVRLVNEPTAAALAYGLDRVAQELRIVVIDFGGGTLDVTVMEFGKGVFEVKATSGDTQLGGTDMNQRIFEHLADRFRAGTGIDVHADRRSAARLLEASETAKIELSTSTTAHISLPYIAAIGGEPRHLELDLTRTEMERLVRPVIDRCRGPVEQALGDAGIGPRDIERIVFVGGPTRMPAVRTFFEEMFGRKAEMGVDPMECVAAGATIQAGVPAGEVGEIVLVDVTPLTLGVETLGGIATPLIGRNTPIPVKRSEIFTTAADMQTAVTVHVFQGERPMAADNTSPGEFTLSGLPPAPRGVPKIEVIFDIDASGILSATAKDLATSKSQSIRITGSTRLPEDEKRRMIAEAERYAEADRKRREDADRLNAADAVAYQAERMLADVGEKIPADTRGRIEAALRDTRAALGARDTVAATERAEALKRVLREAGLERVLTGGQQTVRVSRPKMCAACRGSGAKAGTSARRCQTCQGTGEHVASRREGAMMLQRITPCEVCAGRGQVIDQRCPECGGRGGIVREETLTVDIPVGAEEGMARRIPGHGLPSEGAGGVAGDLFVIIRSAHDTRFERDGADLWRTETISIADAVLGIRREVPTLDGKTMVTIPSGTQPEAVMRLRGKGLPKLGGRGRGDLYLRGNVHVPERVLPEERKLYERLRALGRTSERAT